MRPEPLLIALCVVVRAAFEAKPGIRASGSPLARIPGFTLSGEPDDEQCVKNGEAGICKNIRNCPSALEDLKKHINPQLCGFDNTDPIVCCVNGVTTPAPTQPPIATTTKRPVQTQTTTEYEPPLYEYETVGEGSSDCPPIDSNLTSPKTGQKAWDKCLEYQEQLVYPCEKAVSLSFNSGMERKIKCHMNADDLIIGGQNTSRNEFPHMALLGFGEEPNVQWLCGGSLISENFILTAGHCISSRDAGNLTYVYIGALARSEVTDPSQQYRIKKIHKHQNYKPPNRYNDIALLELERNVKLDEWIKPACLDVGDETNDARVWATGWGLTQYEGSSANILQKVVLNKFTSFECMIQYPPHRHMKQGFDPKTQTCYGDKSQSKDTCQGDSGGPLQIKHKKINCMFLIFGVTSFGKACGFIGEPGIYTKVSYYIPWIESIVWP